MLFFFDFRSQQLWFHNFTELQIRESFHNTFLCSLQYIKLNQVACIPTIPSIFFLTLTLFISVGYSAAAFDDKSASENSSEQRNVKGAKSNLQENAIVSGTYIVPDKTSAAAVKSTATATVTSLQALKQQLISNGTIPFASNNVAVNVQPELIFTKSVKGFVIQGIHDSMYTASSSVASCSRTPIDQATHNVANITSFNANCLWQQHLEVTHRMSLLPAGEGRESITTVTKKNLKHDANELLKPPLENSYPKMAKNNRCKCLQLSSTKDLYTFAVWNDAYKWI
jgi:hypothetical protein